MPLWVSLLGSAVLGAITTLAMPAAWFSGVFLAAVATAVS